MKGYLKVGREILTKQDQTLFDTSLKSIFIFNLVTSSDIVRDMYIVIHLHTQHYIISNVKGS